MPFLASVNHVHQRKPLNSWNRLYHTKSENETMKPNLRWRPGTGPVSSWRPGPGSLSCWQYLSHIHTAPDPHLTAETTHSNIFHLHTTFYSGVNVILIDQLINCSIHWNIRYVKSFAWKTFYTYFKLHYFHKEECYSSILCINFCYFICRSCCPANSAKTLEIILQINKQ